MDFLNKNQKVYIGEEEKKVFLEKLKRDVEVMTGIFRNAIFYPPPPFFFLFFWFSSIYNMKALLPLILCFFCIWEVGYV
jgi:hypothetical protein